MGTIERHSRHLLLPSAWARRLAAAAAGAAAPRECLGGGGVKRRDTDTETKDSRQLGSRFPDTPSTHIRGPTFFFSCDRFALLTRACVRCLAVGAQPRARFWQQVGGDLCAYCSPHSPERGGGYRFLLFASELLCGNGEAGGCAKKARKRFYRFWGFLFRRCDTLVVI